MAKDNDQFAREKKLAREYEKKMAARFWESKRKTKELLEPFQLAPYEPKNFSALFGRVFVPAFSQGKYRKPSAFFQAEMPWIYEYIIYDRFRDAFHNAVDRVMEYPYSVGWGRRSFRSVIISTMANGSRISCPILRMSTVWMRISAMC